MLLSRHYLHSPNINPASEITIHRQLSQRVINKIPIGSADDESRVEYLNMMTLYSSTQNMPPAVGSKAGFQGQKDNVYLSHGNPEHRWADLAARTGGLAGNINQIKTIYLAY
ncbi:hypothetical protein ACB376_10630 [Klebsiella electrica]